MGFLCWKDLPREDWVDVLWNSIVTSWHLVVKCSTTTLPFTEFDWFCLKDWEGKLLPTFPPLWCLLGLLRGWSKKGNMRKSSLSLVQFIGLVDSSAAMTHSPKIAWICLLSLTQCWGVGSILKFQSSLVLLVPVVVQWLQDRKEEDFFNYFSVPRCLGFYPCRVEHVSCKVCKYMSFCSYSLTFSKIAPSSHIYLDSQSSTEEQGEKEDQGMEKWRHKENARKKNEMQRKKLGRMKQEKFLR